MKGALACPPGVLLMRGVLAWLPGVVMRGAFLVRGLRGWDGKSTELEGNMGRGLEAAFNRALGLGALCEREQERLPQAVNECHN